jgi:hypothetical protein
MFGFINWNLLEEKKSMNIKYCVVILLYKGLVAAM